MHIYIYDSALSQKKYLAPVHEIEARVTDLGLSGRVARLGKLRSLRDIVREELRRMPKTIIAVGDDSLVSQVISLMGGTGVALGIIPIGEKNQIAAGLGITLENACNVLSARRIIEIDLGLVDNRAFVRRAEIFGPKLKMLIDGNYSVEAPEAKTEVINFLLESEQATGVTKPDAQSGSLYLMITKEKNSFLKKELERSLVPFRELDIQTDTAEVVLDGLTKINHPRRITIMPNGLQVIVGRERNF
jgi:diacylglycerol kinase family enzyme